MKLIYTLAVCALVGAAAPATAEEGVGYRFCKDVERGPATAEEIIAFTLDSDIYAATRNGLPDLRVLDLSKADTPVEAPYQIEPQLERRAERVRRTLPTKIMDLKENGNNIEIRLSLPEKSPAAEGFSFSTPLKDFERKVQVAGSEDGKNWTPLTGDGVIFDYSRYMDVSNHDVALPTNSFRQFKITVEDVTEERQSPFMELERTMRGGKEQQRVETSGVERRPLRINHIDMIYYVSRELVERAKNANYPVVEFKAKEDAEKKQTIIEVITRREPLTSFTLETPSKNFSRRASVQIPMTVRSPAALQPDRTEWAEIGSATVSKLQFRGFNREKLAISFPEHREEKYRIVIDNQDNPPLEIKGVKAEGNVYRLVFLAQQGKPYRVFYGSEKAEAPKYEAATVLGALGKGFQPVEVQLGRQTDNAAFAGEPDLLLRRLLNNWIFLGAAIALMVAVLGWGLFRAGRHLDQLPNE
jgi:hypothetical protein